MGAEPRVISTSGGVVGDHSSRSDEGVQIVTVVNHEGITKTLPVGNFSVNQADASWPRFRACPIDEEVTTEVFGVIAGSDVVPNYACRMIVVRTFMCNHDEGVIIR